jgi:hypothetical protein
MTLLFIQKEGKHKPNLAEIGLILITSYAMIFAGHMVKGVFS